ncbi:MAG: hypothetical protein F6K35_46165 [Okeania sp. SIO2H7]|nr:hypothetical protein [Okeania sp. SIO2H7]
MPENFIYFPSLKLSVNLTNIVCIRWGKSHCIFLNTGINENVTNNTITLDDPQDKEKLEACFNIKKTDL